MQRAVGLRDIALYFLRLGALGFGGPIALASTMQRDLVERRGWFTREEYLEGLAAAQTLPGPLAAQLAMWLGYVRHGVAGAIAASVPFILPPFVIVTAIAALYVTFQGTGAIQALFYGIGPAVIALILRGAWKLVRSTIRAERELWLIFAAVAVLTFVVRSEVAISFLAAGLIGIALNARSAFRVARSLVLLPWPLSAPPAADPDTLAALGAFFFKAGAFTFGSGLAIVPFLQQGVVQEHAWLTQREFLDSVAVGMITPGPVVITAVFVGYLVAGFLGGMVAAIGVFLPPFLMVVLLAPLVTRYRKHPAVQGFTRGASAAAAVAIFTASFIVLWRTKLAEPMVVAAAAVVGLAVVALR
jgi:chromate transporter